MITPDGKHFTIKGVVVWDGITNPDTDNAVGKPKWSCKIVIDPNTPELAEAQQIATNELNEGKFKGVMPHGGLWIIAPVQETDKFNIDGMFNGFMWMNSGTYQGQPQIFDQNGQLLHASQIPQFIYPGAVVEFLCNCYTYDNKSKGVAAGLSGIKVINNQTPRLQIGGSGIDAGTVFGAPGQAQQQVPINNAAPIQQQQPQMQTVPNGAQGAGGATIQQNVAQPAANQLGAPGALPAVGAVGNQQQQIVTPNFNYTQP